MKLGLQGVSVVLASGDSGVAGPPGEGGNADGCLGTGQIFAPDFPATSVSFSLSHFTQILTDITVAHI